jgi:hypothetical protein
MTIKIILPTNKAEATFVVELLRRLKLTFEVENDAVDELNALLNERLADMDAYPDDVISWEKIRERDKKQKATL